MTAPAIASEKYVCLTTYKKDGTTKELPVWIADLGDGTVGFTTSSSSYKVKRLKNNNRLILQPSDSKGKVAAGSQPVEGSAQIGTGADFERVQGIVKQKYGIQYTGISLVGKMAKLIGKGSGTDTAVIITLD